MPLLVGLRSLYFAHAHRCLCSHNVWRAREGAEEVDTRWRPRARRYKEYPRDKNKIRLTYSNRRSRWKRKERRSGTGSGGGHAEERRDLRDWKGTAGPYVYRTSALLRRGPQERPSGAHRSGGRILLYCTTFVIRAHVPTHVVTLYPSEERTTRALTTVLGTIRGTPGEDVIPEMFRLTIFASRIIIVIKIFLYRCTKMILKLADTT